MLECFNRVNIYNEILFIYVYLCVLRVQARCLVKDLLLAIRIMVWVTQSLQKDMHEWHHYPLLAVGMVVRCFVKYSENGNMF
jgi:hypothetical protein